MDGIENDMGELRFYRRMEDALLESARSRKVTSFPNITLNKDDIFLCLGELGVLFGLIGIIKYL